MTFENNRLNKPSFSPLLFLASLGAGGIAVIPFAFLQYTFEHGKGLIKYADIGHGALTLGQEFLFRSFEGVMIIFALIHLLLTAIFLPKLIRWIKSVDYKSFIKDPIKNTAILAPFISIAMTFNVFIGPIRYFIPSFAANLQALMLPALIAWIILFTLTLRMNIRLLKISFTNGFDIEKITFGWLLYPFSLAMASVVGSGIAAMAKDPATAHIAAFITMIGASMGFFLMIVKLVMIFKSHYSKEGLPEKHFMPSFLIVVPNITLFAIIAFRLGHYLENQFSYHLGPYFLLVTTVAFAFEIWYLLFGLSLMRNYFKNHYFRKEYYVTQWGLICPIVAFAVLGSFVYKNFVGSPILYWSVVVVAGIAIVFYLDLLIRHIKCAANSKKIECAA